MIIIGLGFKKFFLMCVLVLSFTRCFPQSNSDTVYSFLPLEINLGDTLSSSCCRNFCRVDSLSTMTNFYRVTSPNKTYYNYCGDTSYTFFGQKIKNMIIGTRNDTIAAIKLVCFYRRGIFKALVTRFGSFGAVDYSDKDMNYNEMLEKEPFSYCVWKLPDDGKLTLKITKNVFHFRQQFKATSYSIITISKL